MLRRRATVHAAPSQQAPGTADDVGVLSRWRNDNQAMAGEEDKRSLTSTQTPRLQSPRSHVPRQKSSAERRQELLEFRARRLRREKRRAQRTVDDPREEAWLVHQQKQRLRKRQAAEAAARQMEIAAMQASIPEQVANDAAPTLCMAKSDSKDGELREPTHASITLPSLPTSALNGADDSDDETAGSYGEASQDDRLGDMPGGLGSSTWNMGANVSTRSSHVVGFELSGWSARTASSKGTQKLRGEGQGGVWVPSQTTGTQWQGDTAGEDSTVSRQPSAPPPEVARPFAVGGIFHRQPKPSIPLPERTFHDAEAAAAMADVDAAQPDLGIQGQPVREQNPHSQLSAQATTIVAEWRDEATAPPARVDSQGSSGETGVTVPSQPHRDFLLSVGGSHNQLSISHEAGKVTVVPPRPSQRAHDSPTTGQARPRPYKLRGWGGRHGGTPRTDELPLESWGITVTGEQGKGLGLDAADRARVSSAGLAPTSPRTNSSAVDVVAMLHLLRQPKPPLGKGIPHFARKTSLPEKSRSFGDQPSSPPRPTKIPSPPKVSPPAPATLTSAVATASNGPVRLSAVLDPFGTGEAPPPLVAHTAAVGLGTGEVVDDTGRSRIWEPSDSGAKCTSVHIVSDPFDPVTSPGARSSGSPRSPAKPYYHVLPRRRDKSAAALPHGSPSSTQDGGDTIRSVPEFSPPGLHHARNVSDGTSRLAELLGRGEHPRSPAAAVVGSSVDTRSPSPRNIRVSTRALSPRRFGTDEFDDATDPETHAVFKAQHTDLGGWDNRSPLHREHSLMVAGGGELESPPSVTSKPARRTRSMPSAALQLRRPIPVGPPSKQPRRNRGAAASGERPKGRLYLGPAPGSVRAAVRRRVSTRSGVSKSHHGRSDSGTSMENVMLIPAGPR